jgi:hypothetical protein
VWSSKRRLQPSTSWKCGRKHTARRYSENNQRQLQLPAGRRPGWATTGPGCAGCPTQIGALSCDGTPVPVAVLAATENWYWRPLMRPVIVREVAVELNVTAVCSNWLMTGVTR